MAQLADILVGSTVPLHPRFGKNPRLSLQLIQGEKILEETRAALGDKNGIWEIDSPINLPDTDQSLTLAVVVRSRDSKRRLVSAILRVPDLCSRLKAAPNEYYEFTTCDSCGALQVVLSCFIKPTTSITMETSLLDPWPQAFPGGSHRLTHAVGSEIEVPTTSQGQRELLEASYAQILGFPESERKIDLLSTISRSWHAIYNDSQVMTDLDKAISIQREAVNLAYFHPRLAQNLGYLSGALEVRYDYGGNCADIDEAIQASQNALSFTQRNTPERVDHLMKLASNHASRFKRLGDAADIDVAVSTYSEGVALMHEENPGKSIGHNNLARALLLRFERLGALEDLGKAISNLENSISLTPDEDSNKPLYYANLGGALELRFERLGDLADLKIAITTRERAISLTLDGDPNKPLHYSNLGDAFKSRFERFGVLSDLEIAITNLENGVKLTPDGHPDKPPRYSNLGSAFLCRFKRLGVLSDLEMAIINMERALKLTSDEHRDKPGCYINLGNALKCRFERLGDLANLEMAITNMESATKLMPDGHPRKPLLYNTLGGGMQSRFERLGVLSDLERAIINIKDALRLTPDGHPDKSSYHTRLTAVLLCRFERLGVLSDLEMAITNMESAVRLTPSGHPAEILHYNNLASVLYCRFRRLGVFSDLEMAITNMESAAKLMPNGHPNKQSFHNNLGNLLQLRFERLGDRADLEVAITNQESALRLTPDGHPDKHSRHYNLGSILQCRFEHMGEPADLEMAIANKESALRLTPDGHPDKPSRYSNLGISLKCRFERLGDLADLDMAISNQASAARLTPDGHPDKVSIIIQLANCYESRVTSSQNRSDLEMTHSLYATAAQLPAGRPQQRFRAALRWAVYANVTDNSPLPAFKCAIDQLPRIAWLGIPVSEQHSLLEEVGSGVRDAVASAIEVDEYEMAVEWVEQGRSLVWQNLLKLRTPLDDLRGAHPELAVQLQSISQQLDAPAGRDLIPLISLNRSQEDVSKSHTRLAIEWDELVDKIRKLPNFEAFMKPKGFDFMLPAAREGPVVILNVSKLRCDALALIPDDNDGASVVSIALENFTLEKSQKLLQEMKNLLRMAGVRDGDTRASKRVPHKSDPKARFKSTLRMLWMEVVKPVLDGLAYQPQTTDLPRIWWCATGPLVFLPIHAAGDYDATEVGYKLSDYAVSSYTPTLTAILDSSYPNPSKDFKLLTVAQPSAPNCSLIPKTMEEVARIARVAGGVCVVSLAEEEATVERVQRGIRESNWVHLACHGKQDFAKPLESCLILRDGTLKLATIVQETLSNAEFAFLSACQTAMGDEKVEEESVHLAAGMLLAGYRGVIATMWSIRDDDGPRVAEVVYSRMLKDGKPNMREAAYALHDAVKQLRDSGADFASWVPFIHIGR